MSDLEKPDDPTKKTDNLLFEFQLDKGLVKPYDNKLKSDPKLRAALQTFEVACSDFLQDLKLNHHQINNKEELETLLTQNCDNLSNILHAIDPEVLKNAFGLDDAQIKLLRGEVTGKLDPLKTTIKAMADKFEDLKINLQTIGQHDKNNHVQTMISLIESFQKGANEINAVLQLKQDKSPSHQLKQ